MSNSIIDDNNLKQKVFGEKYLDDVYSLRSNKVDINCISNFSKRSLANCFKLIKSNDDVTPTASVKGQFHQCIKQRPK